MTWVFNMRMFRRTSHFRKDIKRMQRRGKKFHILKEIIALLSSGQKLKPQYKDHILIGEYKGSRECHIEPDWLLIYELTDDELILIRTGTHSDLFR